MKKYRVRYSTSWGWSSGTKIDADSPTEAYKLFLKQTGAESIPVVVGGFFSSELFHFDDHVVEVKKKTQEKKEEDSVYEFQKSGWATFLNVCGVLNLVICLAGLALMADSSGQSYYNALYLMIVGLVASINSFLFAFLVNTFTRIQHNTHLTQINTHQTTLELKKLNNKNESKI